MKIGKTIGSLILSGAVLSHTTSCCPRGPLHQISKETVDSITKGTGLENLTRVVDSVAKKSQEILKDSTYKTFGYDTVSANRSFVKCPDDYMSDLADMSDSYNSLVQVGIQSGGVLGGVAVEDLAQGV